MQRLLAVALIALTSLSLGHAPCCLLSGTAASSCCAAPAEEEARGRCEISCPHCQRDRPDRPQRRSGPQSCDCPTLVGGEVPASYAFADLPLALSLVQREVAPLLRTISLTLPVTRAPPEVAPGRSQPLLL